MDESGIDGAQCSRKVVSGKKVAGAIRSLVISMDLHETLLVPILMYGKRRKDLELWLCRWTSSEDC